MLNAYTPYFQGLQSIVAVPSWHHKQVQAKEVMQGEQSPAINSRQERDTLGTADNRAHLRNGKEAVMA